MKILYLLTTAFLACAFAAPSFAQENAPSPAAGSAAQTGSAPNEQQMMQQMAELAKLNENHKMLTDTAGTWSYIVKWWMDGDSSKKPETSKGTAVRKSIMNGRYIVMDVSGKMEMPGPDGKKQSIAFKGQGTEGYDNVKKKFVGAWMDNMGTGIMMTEGDYDPATKTLTSTGEVEMMPGMKQKIREVVKFTDKNHMDFEWYEDRGGKEVKTMEINYSRGGK